MAKTAQRKKHARVKKIAPIVDVPINVSPQVSPFQQKRNFQIKRPVVAILVVVVLLGGAGYWFVSRDSNDSAIENKLNTTKDAELFSRDDYQGLTQTQVEQKLKDEANIDLRALAQRTLSANDFRSFEHAYVAAQAWAGMSNYSKALEAFVIAASMAPKNVNYEFYVAYSECAVLAGDKSKAKEQIVKAKQALEADTKVDTQVRKDLLQKLDDRLMYIDFEAGAPEG